MTPRRPIATTRLLPSNSILLSILSCVAIALFLLISGGGGGNQQHKQQQRHSISSIFGETTSAAVSNNNDDEPDFSISVNMKSSSSSIGSSRNMVGGYSSTMDIQTISKNSELNDIANFAFHEYMTSPSSPALATAQTTTSTSTAGDSSSSSFVMATPEEVEGNRVQIKVLEAQTQVVAGLNYKLTLAIVEGGENTTNNNSNNNNILCRGFIRGITIYKPLPHTGQGLSVTSWGKPMDCNSADKELLDLLHDATMMDDEDENGKENALVVEDALEEEWEEVEPDT